MKNKLINIRKLLFISLIFCIGAALALTQSTGDESIGWPRSIEVKEGKVTIYQPQIDSLKNDILEGRSALSITLKGKTEPIFGAAWYKARIETDRDNRMVNILNIEIPRVRFPDATPEQEKKLIALMEQEMPKWDISFSLDRLLAALDLAEKEQITAENLKVDPPKILVEYEPAVLIFIDGDPIREDIEQTNLERIVNTPFLIIYDKKSRAYYLNGGQVWMTSIDIMGPWKHVKAVPKEVAQFTPEESEETEETDLFKEDERLPNVIVATEPTELISIDGKPEYKPIKGTDLLYLSNIESDVLMDVASQQYFILLSGRWYTAKSMNGPWTFVPSDKLPESFVNIPEDSENANILPFIAGTDQATEAVLDAQIPQTSAVKREKPDLKVEYDGKPQFKEAENTSVEYAVNTSSAVFKVNNLYYCCNEAVWYVSKKPEGPWEVCDAVPDEIYTIPPSCPHYNTKYVYVYDSTPSVVYVGYYPGYVGSYVYGPTMVYGTGWYYTPWYGRYYYPHHWTWGFHVRWNPWYGWSFGFSFGTGPFRFTIGFGGRGGWWGPAYPRRYWHRGGYRAAYRAGYRDGYRRSQVSHYQRGGRDVARTVDRSNVYNRSGNVARNVERPQTRDMKKPNAAQGQRNNVYTDRNGNVYRRQDNGNWQKRDNGKWSSTQQPSTRDKSQVKQQTPSRDRSRSLESQHKSRQRGSTRTQQYQRSRSTGGRTRRR